MSATVKEQETLRGFLDELRKLHEETHPPREPGEFTIEEYAKATNQETGNATAELAYLASIGKVKKGPQKRYINSHMRVVYRKA